MNEHPGVTNSQESFLLDTAGGIAAILYLVQRARIGDNMKSVIASQCTKIFARAYWRFDAYPWSIKSRRQIIVPASARSLHATLLSLSHFVQFPLHPGLLLMQVDQHTKSTIVESLVVGCGGGIVKRTELFLFQMFPFRTSRIRVVCWGR